MFPFRSKIVFVCVVTLFSAVAGEPPNSVPTEAFSSRDAKIIAAHVIFRHGDRNVAGTCPKDPYRHVSNWPGGFGQLTEVGKDRLFRLGEYVRRRYDQLLGDTYSSDRIYIHSTDTDRTLMSAQLMLAGCFKPTSDRQWNNIIPVYSTPREFDFKLGGNACSRLQHLYDDYLNKSPEVQQIYKEYKKEFKLWSEKSGCNISTINQVFNLYDTLTIEHSLNKTLENWALEAIQLNGAMENIVKAVIQSYSGTTEIKKLNTGFLIKDFIEHFDSKINSTERSVWFYSAHDFTIANVLNAIGITVASLPPYTSSVHFELIKLRGEHYIQILYRKMEDEYPEELDIPGCGKMCTLQEFFKCHKDIIPNDFNSECIDPCPLDGPNGNTNGMENEFFFLGKQICQGRDTFIG